MKVLNILDVHVRINFHSIFFYYNGNTRTVHILCVLAQLGSLSGHIFKLVLTIIPN